MTQLTFTTSEKTLAIVSVLKNMSFGQVMTYQEMTDRVGFPVDSRNHFLKSARDIVLRDHSVEIVWAEKKISFRRTTVEEVARAKKRFDRIRGQAKRGQQAIVPALRSNNLREQAVASTTAAKLSLARGLRAESNREIPSDRISSRREA